MYLQSHEIIDNLVNLCYVRYVFTYVSLYLEQKTLVKLMTSYWLFIDMQIMRDSHD